MNPKLIIGLSCILAACQTQEPYAPTESTETQTTSAEELHPSVPQPLPMADLTDDLLERYLRARANIVKVTEDARAGVQKAIEQQDVIKANEIGKSVEKTVEEILNREQLTQELFKRIGVTVQTDQAALERANEVMKALAERVAAEKAAKDEAEAQGEK